MAKKKSTKKGKSKKGGKKGGLLGGLSIDTAKLIGMAGGIFGKKKGLDSLTFLQGLDPKMKAAAIIAIGELAPKQNFVKNLLKDEKMLNGAGDAITVLGMADLLAEFGIAENVLGEDTELAVALEGIDDIEVDEDVLGEDDDIDIVNEDVLGEDDDDEIAEDDMGDDEDIDIVNGDDDDDN